MSGFGFRLTDGTGKKIRLAMSRLIDDSLTHVSGDSKAPVVADGEQDTAAQL